jgi:DNA recombination protein RmuC
MDAGSIGWGVAAVTAVAAVAFARAAAVRAAQERREAASELAVLRERAQRLAPEAGRAIELGSRVIQLEAQGERLHGQLREAEARVARAEAELEAARAAHEQTRAFLAEAQTRLSTAFHEVASKLFDEKSMALDQKIKESGEASKQGIDATLKPFADQLGQFRARIEQFTSDQGKDHARLVGALGELRTLNQNMAEATGSLTRALKGNAKARGDWGEMILETVLKASGLVEGANYQRQGGARDEEGRLHRPDVVILLPDGRRVVVDSKVNLVAWSEMNEAETPEQYQDALLRHAAAMRVHLRELADKNYPKLLGSEALDLTVMFVPIEGAMAAALSLNADLQTEAFQRKVVFASPNTLMALLTVVERLWTRDKLQKQVGLIGEDAGKVLDAVTSFLDDFDKLGMHLQRAGDAFTQSQRRLRDSDQSVVARTRRLVEQGAKGKKLLREELQPTAPSGALPLLLEDNPAAEEPKLL